MVGNYKSYFRNVKRKGKVIFDHSTTLSWLLLSLSSKSLLLCQFIQNTFEKKETRERFLWPKKPKIVGPFKKRAPFVLTGYLCTIMFFLLL